MIDTKAIRKKILDLALRGKLTEQLPEDGTAEELYQQIQAEKQALIQSGKIKKEKPFSESPVFKPYPFEIPNSWRFVRFGELLINRDSERIPISVADRRQRKKTYDYYGASGVIDGIDDYLFDKDLLLIGEDGANLLARSSPVAFIASGQYWVNNHAHVLDVCSGTDLKYVCVYINAISLEKYVTGSAQPKMNQENMNAVWVALPPLAEQKRIVDKIEQAFSVLDTIDELQAKYADNLTVLKSKLIDLAIRGKLTEQLPEDGTAEELYQQIQAEKQALIQSGKIKKEKPLPEIAEAEIPFEIPENWKWSYLGDLFQHNTGKALNAKDTHGQMLEYITTSNLYWDHFELKELKRMPFTDEEVEKCTVKNGDLLVCEGGDIGRSAIWPYDYEMRIQNHIHRLRKFGDGICTKYYYYLLLLYKQTGRINGIGIGLQGFSSKRVHSLIVPLPPLAEQQRIVDRLDKLLAVCDEMR